MLEAYFDDSGTHEQSPVLVWGGVAAHKSFLDLLSSKWRARLSEPCEGKPPIRAFHSSHLDLSRGEFEGYGQGERDLTRANFRRIIVECGVTVLAYGISVKDWNQTVNLLRRTEEDAENFVFGLAVREVAKVSKAYGDEMSMQFDKGRDTEKLRHMIGPALKPQNSKSDISATGSRLSRPCPLYKPQI